MKIVVGGWNNWWLVVGHHVLPPFFFEWYIFGVLMVVNLYGRCDIFSMFWRLGKKQQDVSLFQRFLDPPKTC